MIPSHIFIFIGALYAVVLFINYATQLIGEYQDAKSPGKIWDIVWETTPNFHAYEWTTNILPLACLGALFFVRAGDSILYEFFLKFIMILLLRSLTTVSTIFPKHEHCEHSPTWWNALGGCYDKVFSGHTAFVTLFTLIFLREKIIDSTLFWLINLAQMSVIVLTRSHFTVDVILGFIITYLVFDGNYDILKAVK
jgi:hypothetical protein